MRIISHKKIVEFGKKHSDSIKPLDAWFRIVSITDFLSFNDLRKSIPNVDNVGKFTIFNIGGNKYRLIAAIHYNTKMLYVRHILTHKEYDNGKWKE